MKNKQLRSQYFYDKSKNRELTLHIAINVEIWPAVKQFIQMRIASHYKECTNMNEDRIVYNLIKE